MVNHVTTLPRGVWIAAWKIYPWNVYVTPLYKIIASMADHNQRRCQDLHRNSRPQVFLGKGALKICSKFTGEHPCRSVISIKLLCNFIEITLRHGCSPVNLLHIFRTSFPKKTSVLWLLLLFLPVVLTFSK